jgi:hypothetical protein
MDRRPCWPNSAAQPARKKSGKQAHVRPPAPEPYGIFMRPSASAKGDGISEPPGFCADIDSRRAPQYVWNFYSQNR